MFELRRATPADRAAVGALCARLDPRDYLPAAWDAWLADATAEMLVATHRGAIVGCLYAAVVAPGQVFSQGLRILPEHRRLGVATALMAAQTRRLAARGIAIQRGVTAVGNDRARAFFASAGWREVRVVHRRRRRDWVPARGRRPSPLAAPARPLLVSRSGLAHFRRIYYDAAPEELALAARHGRYLERDAARLLIDPPDAEFGTWVSALAGPPDALRALLRDLSPPWTAPHGLTIEAPADPALDAILDELGFPPAAPGNSYVVVEQCPELHRPQDCR
jgi:GNAT superfamily N-acetyltransferase